MRALSRDSWCLGLLGSGLQAAGGAPTPRSLEPANSAGTYRKVMIKDAGLYMSHSLNSLTGVYIGDYIGDYIRGYLGGY